MCFMKDSKRIISPVSREGMRCLQGARHSPSSCDGRYPSSCSLCNFSSVRLGSGQILAAVAMAKSSALLVVVVLLEAPLDFLGFTIGLDLTLLEQSRGSRVSSLDGGSNGTKAVSARMKEAKRFSQSLIPIYMGFCNPSWICFLNVDAALRFPRSANRRPSE